MIEWVMRQIGLINRYRESRQTPHFDKLSVNGVL